MLFLVPTQKEFGESIFRKLHQIISLFGKGTKGNITYPTSCN